MTTIYVLFVCAATHGQLTPPCDQGTKFASAAECVAMVQSLTANMSSRLYKYADGTEGRADRNQALICMSETTAPATFPIWQRVQ
jgi:hypothetical protein